MAKRFSVNGIEVMAESMGNGMWSAVPVDLPGTLLKVLTGKIKLEDFLNPHNLTITPLESLGETSAPEEVTPKAEVRAKSEKTIREYRKAEGMSKTDMADYLGVSRRTLGRWEDAGKLASEVGL